MKVTVVGFWGGFPGTNEATTGYLIEHDGFRLLVDCGSGVLAQLQNYISIDELDAIIVTHYHHDHIADIGPMQYARLVTNMIHNQQKELPIYGHTADKEGFSRLEHKGHTKAIPYNPEEKSRIGPFTISFMKTKHPVVCYAMRITAGGKTVVFSADSSYLKEFIPFTQDADLFICECNLYADQDGSKMGHMNSTEVGKIAAAANVKELWITHLPHYGNHQDLVEQASEQYDGQIKLANSGLIWE
ncbi:MBL fold metallo-hydrolase [Bacillus sinesaloumensis]|uniref:MBL fold metallo-hydrolase n=1 Tax=Litchfieldia sinesaloumensis TaxID=1926280 RepID=UPI0009885B2C|nr:MBL fold metallo-hydrolase [Bacillus sinesaloumensis]